MITLNSSLSNYSIKPQCQPGAKTVIRNNVHVQPEFHSWTAAKPQKKIAFQSFPLLKSIAGDLKSIGGDLKTGFLKSVKKAFEPPVTPANELLSGKKTVKQVADEMSLMLLKEPDRTGRIITDINGVVRGDIEKAKQLTKHIAVSLKKANDDNYVIFDKINKSIISSLKQVEKRKTGKA